MKPIMNLSINHPYWNMLFIIVLTFFAFQSASKIKVDNSITAWLAEDSSELQNYKTFTTTFNEHGFISLFYLTDNVFTLNAIDFNSKLIKRFEVVENVKQVSGLSNVNLRIQNGSSSKIEFKDLFKLDSEKAKIAAINNPFISNKFISKDFKMALIRIDVDKNNALINYRTINRVAEVITEPVFKSTNFYISGPIAIYEQINRLSGKESAKFFVINLLLIFVLSIVFYKSVKYALLSFVTIIIAIIWVLGVFTFFGYSASSPTNYLLVLIMISSVIFSSNLIIKYKSVCKDVKYSSSTHQDILKNAIGSILKSNLFLGVSVSGIFLLYVFSEVGVIATFGKFSVFAILVPLFLSFKVLPSLLIIFDKNKCQSLKSNKSNSTPMRPSRLIYWNLVPKKYITIFSILISILLVTGISRVELDSNPLSKLHHDNIIIKSLSIVNDKFQGMFPIEIMISAKNDNLVINSKLKKEIKLFRDKLHQLNTKIVIETPIYNLNAKKIRLTILTPWLENSELHKLTNGISDLVGTTFSNKNFSVVITGELLLRQNLHNKLFDNQLAYIAISSLWLFFVSLIFFNRAKSAVYLTLTPLLLLLMSLGLLSWLSIAIDSATIVFFSISQFIVLNHLNYSVSYNTSEINTVKRSVVVITSILIMCSISLLFSKYMLLSYFALFIIFNIIIAFILINWVIQDSKLLSYIR